MQLLMLCFADLFIMIVFFEDIHNSWLYCFTNPLELGTTDDAFVSSAVCGSRGLVKQYNQELCISSITGCFTKRLQSRRLNSL